MNYNYESNKITECRGKMVTLTNVENEIFNYLYVTNRGKICSYEALSNLLYEENSKKIIAVVICRLRQKLKGKVKIRTVYGKGFIID